MRLEQSERATRRDVIDCVEPATRTLLGHVAIDPPETIARAVERARTAQILWRSAPFAVRRRVLRRMLEHVLDHKHELCELIARVSGKTRENALLGEIWPVAEAKNSWKRMSS